MRCDVGSAASSTVDGDDKGLRRDAAENRRRLLDAAERVFADLGADAPMNEVARVAGVGAGTLYRRFPTKQALVSELARRLINEMVAIAQSALSAEDGSGLEQMLYKLGAVTASRRGGLHRLWHDEQTAALKAEFREIVSQLLVDAQRNRRIRDDVTSTDIDLTMWALRGIIETTQGISSIAWRRHLAVVIVGMRPSEDSLDEPPLSEHLAALAKTQQKTPPSTA